MASETIITPRIAGRPPEPEWLAIVRANVESLRFGIVQLVVHDGRVTQVERTEKMRLPASDPQGST